MRIADTPTVYAALPAARKSYPRVERTAPVPALPRHRRTGEDRASLAGTPGIRHRLPPRGWLVDIYV